MVNPNTKYRFTKGVVLSEVLFFPKGFEFKTGTNGELEEAKFHPSFVPDILSIWIEDGTIEDMNVFKPKYGDTVYSLGNATYKVVSEGVPSPYSFNSSYADYAKYGNVFRSKEDALACAQMMRDVMKNFYTIKASKNQ